MATINMTPELATALVQRAKTEIGETFVANLALDIVLDGTLARVGQLETALAAANKQIEDMGATNAALRDDVERLRARRRGKDPA